MSDNLSRKEIKHDIREDAVLVWIASFLEGVARNARAIVFAGIAFAALVLIGVAVNAYAAGQAGKANDALGEAVDIYLAPVVTDGARPNDTVSPSFATEGERDARAREMFEQLRADYSGSGPATVAAVYLGRLEMQAGNTENARALWQEVVDSGDSMLRSMVEVSLLTLDREAGDAEAVSAKLEAALETTDRDLPTDLILHELAVTYEDLGRSDEAEATYQRLSDEYPESPFAQQALARATELAAGV